MMVKRSPNSLALGLTLVLTPAVALPVYASFGSIEEVVVVARKKEESLQKVPISVTAMTENTIQELRIKSIEDVGTLTPNLMVNASAGGFPGSAACMRGLCRTNTIITEDPMVGTYMDGIYLGKAKGSSTDVVDLERIEILRGPQGTLYGKNTLGGAINIITAKPADNLGLKVDGALGNEGRTFIRATADVPITNNLFAKITYADDQHDPLVSNPEGPDFMSRDRQSGRLALRWLATDSLTVDYAYDRSRWDELPRADQLSYAINARFDQQGNCIAGECTTAGWGMLGIDLEDNATPRFTGKYRSDGANKRKLKVDGHSLIINMDIGSAGSLDNLVLKSLTSKRNTYADTALGYGMQIYYTTNEFDLDTYSQEFQLAGNALDGKVDFTMGIFYYSEEGWESNSQSAPGLFFSVGRRAEIETDAYAAYSEVTTHINEAFDVSMGLRYTYEKKEANNLAYDYGVSPAYLYMDTKQGLYVGAPADYVTSISNDNISPRLSLRYFLYDDSMIYATYSRGYKSGGFNVQSTSPTSWEPFDDVVLDSYELGIKTTFWDRRAQVNLAAFWESIDDMQVQTNKLSPTSGSFEAIISNVAKAKVWGLELESRLLPIAGLELTFSAGYQNAEFKNYLIQDTVTSEFIDISKDRVLEFTPEFNYNFGVRYEWAPTDIGVFSARIDFHGVSSHHFQAVPDSRVGEDGYDLVDARLSLSEIPIGEGDLTVALWGKNLSDESYRVGGYNFTSDFGFNTYGEPRSYGLEFIYHSSK